MVGLSNYLYNLAFSPRGTVLLAGSAPRTPAFDYYPKFIEAETSRGDSIAGAFVLPAPPQVQETMVSNNSQPLTMLPLTRGQGYVLTVIQNPLNGQAPAYTGAVVRLDANYRVLWRYAYPGNTQNSGDEITFTQVRELADGSLLALARPRRGIQRICWLYHLDGATGAVRNVFTVRPQLPTYARVDYLLPVPADSTFLLVGPATVPGGSAGPELPAGLYVGRVRLPGLARVVTGAAPGQAVAARAVLGAPYPNPASREVRVPYVLAPGQRGQLELRDVLGRKLSRQALAGGVGEVVLPLEGWAAGLYQLTLQVDGQAVATHRVAVEP